MIKNVVPETWSKIAAFVVVAGVFSGEKSRQYYFATVW